MFSYPNIDPVLFSVFGFSIYWYSIAYIAGVVGGWLYISWLNKYHNLLNKDQLDDIILWAIIGIIIGGRLGYVLFYNSAFYLSNPVEILFMRQGGMSFHGGLIGVIVAFFIFSHRKKITWLKLMDMIACAAPIGLFFGRVANFVNGELYGRVTDSKLGMIFPSGGDLPRHPSQLYEATLEGLALFIMLWLLVRYSHALTRKGFCSGVFLLGYGGFRFIIEFFRQPDAHLGFIFFELSMGQLLCIPMILLGLFLIVFSYIGNKNTENNDKEQKHAS